MRIANVEKVGKMPVYDLSVKDVEHYVLENGAVTHNTGAYYSSDAIWIVGRQQEKDGQEIKGYHFVINIEKSRHVREKSKIPITVTFEGGISKWSGLLDVAEQGGFIRKPKMGWYEPINPETGEVLSEKMFRAKEIINDKDFWMMMFEKTDLKEFIHNKYSMEASGLIMREDNVETVEDEVEDDDSE